MSTTVLVTGGAGYIGSHTFYGVSWQAYPSGVHLENWISVSWVPGTRV